jgi:hypothetical protein
MDEDDDTMNNEFIRNFLDDLVSTKVDIKYAYGVSKSKIEAINADMDGESADAVVVVADDYLPIVHGYDDIIFKQFDKHFPQYDGAIKFHDGFRSDDLMTMSVLGWNLYQSLNYLYHPAYRSVYADNELTEVCILLGKLQIVDQCIIQHQWSVIQDSLFFRNENRDLYNQDLKTYEQRKAINFEIDKLKNRLEGSVRSFLMSSSTLSWQYRILELSLENERKQQAVYGVCVGQPVNGFDNSFVTFLRRVSNINPSFQVDLIYENGNGSILGRPACEAMLNLAHSIHEADIFQNINIIQLALSYATKLYADNSIDFIFLDLGQSDTELDKLLQIWWPKIKERRGLIVISGLASEEHIVGKVKTFVDMYNVFFEVSSNACILSKLMVPSIA